MSDDTRDQRAGATVKEIKYGTCMIDNERERKKSNTSNMSVNAYIRTRKVTRGRIFWNYLIAPTPIRSATLFLSDSCKDKNKERRRERRAHRKTTRRGANGKNAQLSSLPSSQTTRDVCEVSDHGAALSSSLALLATVEAEEEDEEEEESASGR